MDTKIQNANIAILDAESHLESRNIHVWFKDRHVLSDVSLQFPTNSVTALIGPSGCGKSTFIRTLNRMHELIPGAGLAGSVYLDNEDIYAPGVDPVSIRLRVGMVFQKPNPFPTMTIKGNVLAGLRLNNRRIKDEDSLVESCLNRASIWSEVKDRLNAPAGSLSGGQQQRYCSLTCDVSRSFAYGRTLLCARPRLDSQNRRNDS
jgi:phosphate transport system ATP-binding protein